MLPLASFLPITVHVVRMHAQTPSLSVQASRVQDTSTRSISVWYSMDTLKAVASDYFNLHELSLSLKAKSRQNNHPGVGCRSRKLGCCLPAGTLDLGVCFHWSGSQERDSSLPYKPREHGKALPEAPVPQDLGPADRALQRNKRPAPPSRLPLPKLQSAAD